VKRMIVAVLAISLFSSSALAADSMKPVFSQIDDLVTRVESGISLNSYAESLAQMKIDYKKAVEDPSGQANYLLSDRMKEVITMLDIYAKLWRVQDIDNFKFLKSGDSSCYVQVTSSQAGYDIACMKRLVLERLKPLIDGSKTAHYDGW
jgi:opacity protein-like surface antigen